MRAGGDEGPWPTVVKLRLLSLCLRCFYSACAAFVGLASGIRGILSRHREEVYLF